MWSQILSAVFMTYESLPLCLGRVPKPDSDANIEDALYKSSVGLGEGAMVEPSLSSLMRYSLFWASFTVATVFLAQHIFPEVHDDLLCLVYVLDAVIILSIDKDVADQFPVTWLIPTHDKA